LAATRQATIIGSIVANPLSELLRTASYVGNPAAAASAGPAISAISRSFQRRSAFASATAFALLRYLSIEDLVPVENGRRGVTGSVGGVFGKYFKEFGFVPYLVADKHGVLREDVGQFH